MNLRAFSPPIQFTTLCVMEDFANALAYEVKQEIANRYFGFRTRIEAQSAEYLKTLAETRDEWDAAIQQDLCRMRFLLREPRLFCTFLDIAGLSKEYALRLTGASSASKGQTLFLALRSGGFTRWRRFRGLAMLVYTSLKDNIGAYHDRYLLLQDEFEAICKEIDRFEKQNSLSEILCFLRNYDSADSERLPFLHSNTAFRPDSDLEHDLRILPPIAADAMISPPKHLTPLRLIRRQFEEILKQAFPGHDAKGSVPLPF